jgi:hypothetical protein
MNDKKKGGGIESEITRKHREDELRVTKGNLARIEGYVNEGEGK